MTNGTRTTCAAAVSAALCLVCMCLMCGCGEDFEPFWKVNKFRILAVKASPVVVEEGGSTTLEVLAHNPGDQPVEYRWDWCPFGTSAQDEFDCPVDEGELEQVLREQTPPGEQQLALPQRWFDLGFGKHRYLLYPGSEQEVRRMCERLLQAAIEAPPNSALASQPPAMDCALGMEISVRVVATVAGEEYVARKRLLLSTGETTVQNINPRLDMLWMQVDRPSQQRQVRNELEWVAETGGSSLFYPASSESGSKPVPVYPNLDLKLWADVEPETIETWRPPAPAGSADQYLQPEREVLSFQWFATAGEFAETESLFVAGETRLNSVSKNVFRVPYSHTVEDFDEDGVRNHVDNCAPIYNPEQTDANLDGLGDACDVFVWVVVRDGRLGLDWERVWLRVVQREIE